MAGCVTVQLGQCGTQVGHQLFATIHEDATKKSIITSAKANSEYEESSVQTFFNKTASGKTEARSVMIDMEPKAVASAVQAMTAKGKGWCYPKDQQFCSRSGAGNNWSYGYKVLASQCEDSIFDIVRREVEKCDHFSGFLILQSLAGGTGSGLSSFITEKLRDQYSYSTQINAVVTPYLDGEVAVQNYNAIFSLAHTCMATDASILLHNDQLHAICNRLLGIKDVSFLDINNIIANQLASLLLPVSSTEGACATTSRYFNVLNAIVSSCASHSQYSLLDIKSLPHIPQSSVAFSTFSWEALMKRIYQMLITDFHMDEGLDWHRKLSSHHKHPRYVSNLLIMRGHQALAPQMNMPDFLDSCLYPRWMPSTDRCPLWKTNMPFQKFEKSITLLSNGTCCVKPLDRVVSRAWQMFDSRAYYHQYSKHGLEEEDFINAFAAVESLISSYKNL